ncbi:MAG: AbrB/MazE/SpoVT family DNA-binding domain-containing protein [Methanoregula sp.]|nr:MAG: AbrB/MazE/SpoVT family DNA-binding domain-containing protein [Methanoregula sp.]
MEIRRVQFTGGSSYVVTLPKEWIDDQKIKKNDPLGIEFQADGTLLVTKTIEPESLQRKLDLTVDGITEPAYLFRLLIGAYISGITTIVITSKERLQPFVRAVVRNFTQMTIGQEVVEENDMVITLKDLLNPSEMPFANTIKRMFVIVKAMHEDAITAIRTGNQSLAADVTARDNDVDRLHWLIARQTHMILSNVALSKKMGITSGTAVHYFVISRIIERIGDHAERIVDNAQAILTKDIDPAIIEKIAKASELSVGIFDRSIVSFFNNDMKKSNKNIESVQVLESLCGEINNLVLQQETPDAIALGYITESLRRSGEYAADISENVINYLVEEKQIQKKGKPAG